MIQEWIGKDKLNKKGARNIDSTNRLDFNCGGYALETFNLYAPYTLKENMEFNLFGGIWRGLETEEVLELTVKSMIKEFRGNLRVIDKVEDLREGEYAIAYRIGCEDFHFAKRNSKGKWFHKRGKSRTIETMTKEEVFSSEGWANGMYYSDVVLLARKRNWN